MRASLDRLLFETHRLAGDSLAVTRMLTAMVFLVAVFPQWLWVPSAPATAYLPPVGVSMLFAAPPSLALFVTLNIVGVACSVLLLVGLWTVPASWFLSGVFVVGNSFHFSFGQIDHGILLVLLPLFGATAGWGAALSVDHWRARQSPEVRAWPIALFAILVAVGMGESGLTKATTGWLDIGAAAVRSHLVVNRFAAERVMPLTDRLLQMDSAVAWEVMDWSTVLLECAFLAAVWRRQTWRAALALATGFHLAILLIFQIAYYPNVLGYSLFVAWPVPGRMAGIVARAARLPAWTLAMSGVVLGVYYTAVGNPAGHLLRLVSSDPLWLRPGLVVAAGFATVAYWAASVSGWWWPSTAAPPRHGDTTNMVFYDGECGLCDRWVQFVLRYDRAGLWHFCPLQSVEGTAMLSAAGLPPAYADSILVVKDGRLYTHATAVIAVLFTLRTWRPLAAGLSIVPSVLRDTVYRIVARHRHGVSRAVQCQIPTPEERSRFVG